MARPCPVRTRCTSPSCAREGRCLDQSDIVAARPAPEPATSEAWTPLQCLEHLLEQARAGRYDPTMLVVVSVYEDERGGISLNTVQAGDMTMAEHFTYLHIAREQALSRMQRV